MLSFFPRDVLDEILDLIESISEGFSTYPCTIVVLHINRLSRTESAIFVSGRSGTELNQFLRIFLPTLDADQCFDSL